MYPSPRLRYQPRTFPDQRTQFENGELFRKLTRESEVSIIILLLRLGRSLVSTVTCVKNTPENV